MRGLRVDVEDVKRAMHQGNEIVFLDVRNPQAWEESDQKIPGAIRVTVEDLERGAGILLQDHEVVAYCT